MAYKYQASVTGHINMLHEMIAMIAGLPTLGTPAYTGTGNGLILNETAVGKHTTETWTITCTTAAANGGTFSVVGSVSGAQANATVGTHYDNGLISFIILDGTTDFVVTDFWTIAATTNADNSTENWDILRRYGAENQLYSSELGTNEAINVIGEGSGNRWFTADGQAIPCYIGETYITEVDITRFYMAGVDSGDGYSKNPKDFSLQYSDDGTNWTTHESWTGQEFVPAPSGGTEGKYFNVTATSTGKHKHWRIYITANSGAVTNFTGLSAMYFYETIDGGYTRCNYREDVIFQGEGLAAQDELFVGMQVVQRRTDDVYNLQMAAFDGYLPSLDFDAQPNASTLIAFPSWNLGIEYRLICNKQRFACIAKIDTFYHSMYLGKWFPYNSPGQFPYNICVGGSGLASNIEDYSWTSWAMPFKGSSTSRLIVRDVSGDWIGPWCWPWAQGSAVWRDSEGEHAVLPIVMGTSSVGLWGQLDGVFFCSGFNNAVENIIEIGADDYFVCHDVYRTGNDDHFCMLLE